MRIKLRCEENEEVRDRDALRRKKGVIGSDNDK
jgi:hypothetical protein